MSFIRSISGIRATLGDGLIPDLIAKYAAGFANYLPEGQIIIGRDGRPSGIWMEHLVAGTLAACGREVTIIGAVPTPTVQLTVEKSDAAGGISITASHNPQEWNGLKFLNGNGVFLNKEENLEFWNHIDKNKLLYSLNPSETKITYDLKAVDRHIISVINILEDIKIIRKKNYFAVVDAVNASGSIAVPELLNALGCRINCLHCDASGIFPHTPEPVPDNLTELAKTVKSVSAHIGIAVDPDADRLVLIDEKGNSIGEEKTIALAVKSVLSSEEVGDEPNVVVNYSTSRMVDDVCEEFGAKLYRSPVGEINVVEKMKQTEAVIGGEGSGGVIYPECHYGRDSLVGIALIMKLMAESDKTLTQLSAEFTDYKMIKLKREFHGDIRETSDKIENEFPRDSITRDDGIKIDLEEGWVQLRTSNTEPIVRIIAEARTQEEARQLTDKIIALL